MAKTETCYARGYGSSRFEYKHLDACFNLNSMAYFFGSFKRFVDFTFLSFHNIIW